MGDSAVNRRSIGSIVSAGWSRRVLLRPWERRPGGGAATPSACAYVVRAVDGDTIEVRFDGRLEDVRYIGVDTPETVKPDTPVQCFGPRASSFDHHLVEHRRVRLVFGVERRDIYGRLLAYVYIGTGFVNAILVRRGLARTLTIPPNDRYAPLFRRLELTRRAGRARALGRLPALNRLLIPLRSQLCYGAPRPPGHPSMRMRQSISQFENAFEQETSLERRRREQLRRRAANRSRARKINRSEQEGKVRFSVLAVCLTVTVVVVVVIMFEALAFLMS